MTTAHRPTWKAAVGKSGEGGWNSGGIGGSAGLSHLDLPAHTKLKFRVSKVFYFVLILNPILLFWPAGSLV